MEQVYSGSIVQAINAKVYGNGTKTLILSHGFGTDQTVWHFLVPHLSQFFRVVVIDLAFAPNVEPGFYDDLRYSNFDAYATDLLRLMDEMNISKAVFMGHSMSAMIGCIAATRHPELFEHLILLCASPRYLNEEGYFGGLNQAGVNGILSAMEENYSGWVEGFPPTAVGANNTDTADEFKHMLGRMKPETALAVAKTVFLSDYRSILPQVKVPCTLIQCDKDPFVPEAVTNYMKEHIGDGTSRLETIDNDGHFPQLTAHIVLLKAMKSVLNFSG